MNYIRYGLVFLVVALGAALAVRALNTNLDTVLGSSAQLMVPAMIAALIEGQQFAKAQKRKPDSSEIWGFTWIATGVAVVLNVALAYGASGFAPEFDKLAIAPLLGQQFLILLGLYAGGYLICNRFFAGLGAGNQLSLMRNRGEAE
ncbi:hypothetical protein EI983_14480 [Roseovarius faecimaris]|uniref:Uncharacterized protein n=1 Tax=Roseovarius faecimaris TaxID=2494550 RepID=A0A6I6IU23_9RHOB|nr:ABZJ_00895 family protein [Roseovarius faecimaris]QGX99403.1 hypothetical protein EI983_14480 [Roseovarius faecimaris]